MHGLDASTHTSLVQVVHCVMANAFKYTRKGGVTITTEASVDGHYLTFKVIDTGTGFSAEQVRAGGGICPRDYEHIPSTETVVLVFPPLFKAGEVQLSSDGNQQRGYGSRTLHGQAAHGESLGSIMVSLIFMTFTHVMRRVSFPLLTGTVWGHPQGQQPI